MAQAGLHVAFSYQLHHIIPNEKRLFPSIIFGAILPDLDIFIIGVLSLFYPILRTEHLLHRTFSHSFFTIILVYLSFSLVSEWLKKPVFKTIGKGITLGILSHIILDTFIWFREIQFLWPLPFQPFNLWSFWQPPEWINKFTLIFEFFCFYWYAWFLITKHLKYPNKESWIILYLQHWKLIEGVLFVIFLILGYLNSSKFSLFFCIAYIPSILFALWGTYMSRNALEIQ